MKNDKTLEELRAELATAAEAIGVAETELREVEATGDTGAKNLDRHARVKSRLDVLHTQHAAIRAALLPAELAALREAEGTADAAFAAAKVEVETQVATTTAVLQELFDFKDWRLAISSDELVAGAKLVVEKLDVLDAKRRIWANAADTARRFQADHFPPAPKPSDATPCPNCGRRFLFGKNITQRKCECGTRYGRAAVTA